MHVLFPEWPSHWRNFWQSRHWQPYFQNKWIMEGITFYHDDHWILLAKKFLNSLHVVRFFSYSQWSRYGGGVFFHSVIGTSQHKKSLFFHHRTSHHSLRVYDLLPNASSPIPVCQMQVHQPCKFANYSPFLTRRVFKGDKWGWNMPHKVRKRKYAGGDLDG